MQLSFKSAEVHIQSWVHHFSCFLFTALERYHSPIACFFCHQFFSRAGISAIQTHEDMARLSILGTFAALVALVTASPGSRVLLNPPNCTALRRKLSSAGGEDKRWSLIVALSHFLLQSDMLIVQKLASYQHRSWSQWCPLDRRHHGRREGLLQQHINACVVRIWDSFPSEPQGPKISRL
jgi:hypothetical protein